MAKNNDNWSGRVLLSCTFEVWIDSGDNVATQQDAEYLAIGRLERAIPDAIEDSNSSRTREVLGGRGDIEVVEVESDAVDRA